MCDAVINYYFHIKKKKKKSNCSETREKQRNNILKHLFIFPYTFNCKKLQTNTKIFFTYILELTFNVC